MVNKKTPKLKIGIGLKVIKTKTPELSKNTQPGGMVSSSRFTSRKQRA
jgi:hypothetical protein